MALTTIPCPSIMSERSNDIHCRLALASPRTISVSAEYVRPQVLSWQLRCRDVRGVRTRASLNPAHARIRALRWRALLWGVVLLLGVAAGGCVSSRPVVDEAMRAELHGKGRNHRAEIQLVGRGGDVSMEGDSVTVDVDSVFWVERGGRGWRSAPVTSLRRIRFTDRWMGALKAFLYGGAPVFGVLSMVPGQSHMTTRWVPGGAGSYARYVTQEEITHAVSRFGVAGLLCDALILAPLGALVGDITAYDFFPLVQGVDGRQRCPVRDRRILDAFLERDGLRLRYIADDLRDDRHLVMKAVQQNGLALEHASARLRGDAEVVLAAILQNGAAHTFASDSLRNSRSFTHLALHSQPRVTPQMESTHIPSARPGAALPYDSIAPPITSGRTSGTTPIATVPRCSPRKIIPSHPIPNIIVSGFGGQDAIGVLVAVPSLYVHAGFLRRFRASRLAEPPHYWLGPSLTEETAHGFSLGPWLQIGRTVVYGGMDIVRLTGTYHFSLGEGTWFEQRTVDLHHGYVGISHTFTLPVLTGILPDIAIGISHGSARGWCMSAGFTF